MSVLNGSELMDVLVKAKSEPTNVIDILNSVLKNSLERGKEGKIDMGNTIKVRHLSARDCTVHFRNVEVRFDKDGVAEVPATLRDEFEIEMNYRPGIYSFIEEAAPVVEEVKEVDVVTEDKEDDLVTKKGRKGKV